MSKIKINDKFIGDDFPCYTIAEAGANHDGELEKALRLIDAAYDANSDSIKFQTYDATKLASKFAPKYWDDGKPNESQHDVFSNLDSLTHDEWKEILNMQRKNQLHVFQLLLMKKV
tara:strand:+ start:270 stop:617 length:348 start_codon:yes stop_codon:yes gene_type:complete